MKAVILAGGLGTRISEESSLRPKPMIEIGGKPILWHIMKYYASFGIKDFVVCLGYKGYVIKEYFANYYLHTSDVTFRLHDNEMTVHRSDTDDWNVTLVDTGESTMTGGRLKRIAHYVEDETSFCCTYGDGLTDADLGALLASHERSGLAATVTAVQPPGRYGSLAIASDDRVTDFHEKPQGDGGWINGGYFVLSPLVLERIDGDHTYWEREPLETLAADGALHAYKHDGFWQPLDTLRDKNYLESLWASGKAPWKRWA
jgi:glucose-1-phosphate cytidylyltransferase